MHAVFFGMKISHLRVLHVTRALLWKRELTPARFDMMRVVELHKDGGVAQQKVQDLLGVSAPTISRMLKSLEKLGYVVRERMTHDARQKRVHITELGLERVRAARLALIDSGIADRMAARGLCFDPEEARPQVTMLRGFLRSIRKNYGDPAPFEHPWTLDQVVPYYVHTIVDGRLHYGAPLQ